MAVTVADVMEKLASMGSEQTKNTYIRHGAQEPLFGVKVGDLKKLVRDVKKDQQLALALYETGNSDAMYLAGLAADPKRIPKETLQAWVRRANWYMPAEYTVAGVAAESPYALELAREWMRADEELIAVCGWSTYANYLSITPDEQLDLEDIRSLLRQVERTVHSERNRVRYVMNGFVIAAGCYVEALHAEAMRVAACIGKVEVNVGNTACKVPIAEDYIERTVQSGRLGAKRKTCIC